jgi:signal transduction histidine kinase
MTRPWQVWLSFSLALATVLASMAWITTTALRFEALEREARRLAFQEENVRLALWRMDSAVAPIVNEESARSTIAYRPFYRPEQAFPWVYRSGETEDVFVPSPLLTPRSPYVLLHFEWDSSGRLTSPQIPQGQERDFALQYYLTEPDLARSAERMERLSATLGRTRLESLLPPSPSEAGFGGQVAQAPDAFQQQSSTIGNGGPIGPPTLSGGPDVAMQEGRGNSEFQRRAQSLNNSLETQRELKGKMVSTGGAVMTPGWIGDQLFLLRRVQVNKEQLIQGCWLDWPALEDMLLAQSVDLIHGASLSSVADRGDVPARMLASLPVRLGVPPIPSASGSWLSPTRMSLLLAWASVVSAAIAVAVVLSRVVALSERRAAFVSAVTHELRTPLTTFRIYTELLSEGMVADAERRREYLSTLTREADRLAHLVENILAFARLERGRKRLTPAPVELGPVLGRIEPRLRERSSQAGLSLSWDVSPEAECAWVRADASGLEQILFNLVDNAAKYAVRADDKRLHVEAEKDRQWVAIRVRDHGPGVDGHVRRRLFEPFAKSADEAAQTAPGVGLGLALSRRYARSMGGRLELETVNGTGASFVLRLATTGGGAKLS